MMLSSSSSSSIAPLHPPPPSPSVITIISTTILCLLLLLPSLAAAHSWIDHAMLISDNGTLVGPRGYPRGYTSRDQAKAQGKVYDKLMTHMIPLKDNRIDRSAPLCMPTQQDSGQYADAFPALKIVNGNSSDGGGGGTNGRKWIALRYNENGHVSLPQNQKGKPSPSRGSVYVYGTKKTDLKPSIGDVLGKWDGQGQGGDKKGRLLARANFDDGVCHQLNDGAIASYRRQVYPSAGDVMCEMDVPIPDDEALKAGEKYTLYWIWDWPTAAGQDPALKDGKDEVYTTCLDIEVVDKLPPQDHKNAPAAGAPGAPGVAAAAAAAAPPPPSSGGGPQASPEKGWNESKARKDQWNRANPLQPPTLPDPAITAPSEQQTTTRQTISPLGGNDNTNTNGDGTIATQSNAANTSPAAPQSMAPGATMSTAEARATTIAPTAPDAPAGAGAAAAGAAAATASSPLSPSSSSPSAAVPTPTPTATTSLTLTPSCRVQTATTTLTITARTTATVTATKPALSLSLSASPIASALSSPLPSSSSSSSSRTGQIIANKNIHAAAAVAGDDTDASASAIAVSISEPKRTNPATTITVTMPVTRAPGAAATASCRHHTRTMATMARS